MAPFVISVIRPCERLKHDLTAEFIIPPEFVHFK